MSLALSLTRFVCVRGREGERVHLSSGHLNDCMRLTSAVTLVSHWQLLNGIITQSATKDKMHIYSREREREAESYYLSLNKLIELITLYQWYIVDTVKADEKKQSVHVHSHSLCKWVSEWVSVWVSSSYLLCSCGCRWRIKWCMTDSLSNQYGEPLTVQWTVSMQYHAVKRLQLYPSLSLSRVTFDRQCVRRLLRLHLLTSTYWCLSPL